MASTMFHAFGPESPAIKAVAVTPADSDLAEKPTRALYVGTTGDVVVYMADSTTAVTFVGVPAGAVLPICVDQVRAATGASDIVALY